MVSSAPRPPQRRRTIVYIDGFNLYYGAVRNTPALKWLDIARFCRLLHPHDDLRLIRYFSALVEGPTKINQEIYLKALSTTPLVEIILGKFKKKTLRCGVATCTSTGPKLYDTREEKRTDVNIAIFMLDDAYRDQCDQMIIFSGDSDLVPAVQMVRLRFPEKRIVVYVPSQNPVRGAAVELRTSAHAHKTLPRQVLSKAQFPNRIPDGRRIFEPARNVGLSLSQRARFSRCTPRQPVLSLISPRSCTCRAQIFYSAVAAYARPR